MRRRGLRGPRRLPAHTEATARLLGLAVLACGAGWLATSSLQQDFAAYYTAGAAVARGLDPYVNQVVRPDGPWDGVAIYRHSRFLYAPLIAHLFRPLAALPFLWAKALFTALSLGALWAALALVAHPPPAAGAAPPVGRPIGGAPFMRSPWVLGAMWLPVFLTLERGQMDLLLLLALAAAWRFRARAPLAGGLLGLVALVKPAALGIVPVLLAGRQRRWVAATVAALAVLLALNAIVAGRAATLTYLTDVLPRAGRYGEGGPAVWLLPESATAPFADDLGEGRATIDGQTYPTERGHFRRNASVPRLLAGDDQPRAVVIVLGAVALIGAAAWAARRAPDQPLGYWAASVAVVLAAPVSWAMGLVWGLPVLALIPPGLRGRERDVPGKTRLARRFTVLALAAALVGPLLAAAWILAGAALLAAAVVTAIRAQARPEGGRATDAASAGHEAVA